MLIFVHHLPPNFLLAFIAAMIPLAAFLTPPAALIAFFILTILAAVKIVVPITHKIVPAHFVTCQNDGSATTGKAVFSSKSIF